MLVFRFSGDGQIETTDNSRSQTETKQTGLTDGKTKFYGGRQIQTADKSRTPRKCDRQDIQTNGQTKSLKLYQARFRVHQKYFNLQYVSLISAPKDKFRIPCFNKIPYLY